MTLSDGASNIQTQIEVNNDEIYVAITPTKQTSRTEKRENFTPSPTSVIYQDELLDFDKIQEREERLFKRQCRFRILVEYKHLQKNSPRGVYLTPSFQHDNIFHGVIFIRRGLYKNAIFKFKITLPPKYNMIEEDTYPTVRFFADVFHPYVDISNGKLDLTTGFPTWDKDQHVLLSLIMYIKKIFFLPKFVIADKGNFDAWMLSMTDEIGFRKMIYYYVDESQMHVKDDPDSSFIFNACFEEKRFTVLRKLIYNSGKDSLPEHEILNMVAQSTRYYGIDDET